VWRFIGITSIHAYRTPLGLRNRNRAAAVSFQRMTDIFAVFGEEDDDEGRLDLLASNRDTAFGPMQFHRGTEESLLAFVQQQLAESTTTSKVERVHHIMEAVNTFCYQRHWMMHIGPEKAAFLLDHLRDCLDQRSSTDLFIVVELGTYCGYSLLSMASVLLQYPGNFQIITVDIDRQNQAVAREMVALAGLQDRVSFVLLDLNNQQQQKDALATRLHNELSALHKQPPCIDFLFIDHDKDAYLSDLRQCEQAVLIRSGAYVAADNVVVFQLEEYRQHMKELASQGIVETKLLIGSLEYVLEHERNSFKDGVGMYKNVLVYLHQR
jgi:predicted O-methyltransferase YrrM